MIHTFRSKSLLACLLAAGVQFGAGSAVAAPCGGFTDVDDTNPAHTAFCTNVEWIKNRGVTLGCVANVQYCPNDPVSRLQMAAFMQRLGDALSPEVVKLEDSPGAIDPSVSRRICVTNGVDTLPAKGYPRRAFIATTFSGQATGALQYETDIQVSTDNGASWDFVWPSYVNRDGTGGAHWVSSSFNASADLDPNLTYQFALRIEREGGGTATFADTRCFITVAVFSRTGSTSPFDAPVIKKPNADH